MKIIVCIKQVPNTTEIKIDPVTNTLKRDGVPSIINPDDKTAIEAALQLKEKCGATVTVISVRVTIVRFHNGTVKIPKTAPGSDCRRRCRDSPGTAARGRGGSGAWSC